MLLIHLFRAIVRLALPFIGTLTVHGGENIPSSGSYIIVVNHMSKAEPPLVFMVFPPVKMRFFAGEKWESHLIFGALMRWTGAIYINRGEVDRKALREALVAIKEGSVFGLAPEGTRSQVGALIEARDGAAYLATRSKVPLVPVGIANTDLIGRNLPRLRRTQLVMRIGKPFMLPDLGRRAKLQDLPAYTRLIMANVASLLPKRHWGYYADSEALKALLAGEDPWPYCQNETAVSASKIDQELA